MSLDLRPFQRRFIRAALAPGIKTAVLSLPRGNGKTSLAAHLVERALTPGDRLCEPGKEIVQVAASLEQARLGFRMVRAELEPLGDYKFSDSANKIGIRHTPTNTRLRVIASNGRTAMGLVGVPLVIADEPGSWETVGGQLLWEALTGALNKPGSPLKIIAIGTLAPARAGWWPQLIEAGSRGSRYVQALQGDPEKWDQWAEIRRCNPLVTSFPETRAGLLEERDEARADSRLKAAFLSYRMNVPTSDESEVLLTAEDWKRVRAREVPPREGRPIVGIDLGANRSWSAAVAIWPNGRVEARATAPGLPPVDLQERRDRVPGGAYARLVEMGVLRLAPGLRVPPVSMLMSWIREDWGEPELLLCDRFRLPELRDAAPPGRVAPRTTRWSDAAFDIRALRKFSRDGGMACAREDEALMLESILAAVVKNDDQGSCRLAKRDPGGSSARDDVAAALILAAGGYARRPAMATGPRFRVVQRA